jgi:glycosyltransferase involved in cell wall biosynthesis
MEQGKPKVSVIIPTYNRSVFLKDAIESVLRQTFTDYEIIVVDDGSTDDTREVVHQFGALIRYYHQENRGCSAARNLGIRAAFGEYIAFLDSDDVFMPEKLAIQARELDQNPHCGMVYSHALGMDEKGNLIGICWKGNLSGWIYPSSLFIKNGIITTPSVMVRASVLKEVGCFDESLEICEDLDLWRRIARRHPIIQVRESLVKVRLGDSVMRKGIDVSRYLEARVRFYEKAFKEDPVLNMNLRGELFTEMYLRYGILAFRQGKIMNSLMLICKSFLFKPQWIIHMLMTELSMLKICHFLKFKAYATKRER